MSNTHKTTDATPFDASPFEATIYRSRPPSPGDAAPESGSVDRIIWTAYAYVREHKTQAGSELHICDVLAQLALDMVDARVASLRKYQRAARAIRGFAERARNEAPQVGDGATYSIGSDAYPYTVLEVVGPKTIKARTCRVTKVSGKFPDAVGCEFEEDETAPVRTFTLRRNNRWIEKGDSMNSGASMKVGRRTWYTDPHR